MSEDMRRVMGEAAVAAARAVNYVGAGTVEFIVEPNGKFYFMEMNTRLQVEHPVTEMITGLDLVEWQLRVAAGEPLPLTQEQIQQVGHAIEVRIYAENTEKGFLPSVGKLRHLQLPDHVAFMNGDVRVDSGVRCGDEISTYYDPMIAKLIVHGATREQARQRMLQALACTQVAGVHTNVAFLSRLLRDEAFAHSDVDTGLIERRRDVLFPEPTPAPDHVLAIAVVAMIEGSGSAQQETSLDPWSIRDGWRLNDDYRRTFVWDDGDELRRVRLFHEAHDPRLDIDGRLHDLCWTRQRASDGAYRVTLTVSETRRTATVIMQGSRADVFVEGNHSVLFFQDPLEQGIQGDTALGAGLTAPMPGKIIAVNVRAGQRVKKGDALLVMEAMKMEHAVIAPAEGVVKEVYFGVGEQVSEGVTLIALA
jgi:3-methylcrotonyl-CoA carboxylase alpha subunit